VNPMTNGHRKKRRGLSVSFQRLVGVDTWPEREREREGERERDTQRHTHMHTHVCAHAHTQNECEKGLAMDVMMSKQFFCVSITASPHLTSLHWTLHNVWYGLC